MSAARGAAGLRKRAERAGLQLSYQPVGRLRPRRISNDTLRRLLAVLGTPAPRRLASPAPGPPPRCVEPTERIGKRRAFGLWANLYTLRSDRGYGVGNLGDLRRLVRWAGAHGAAFVGVNPLHALRNREPDVSPYQPVSRLFRNGLYLDPSAAPEWPASPAARRLFDGPQRARLLAGTHIDYAGASALHAEVTGELHRTFRRVHLAGGTARARAFERFRREGGTLLRDFATFCALEAELSGPRRRRGWPRWPAAYRSRDAAALERFRAERPEVVERVLWEQFELDRQLAGVAREAERSGVPLGLYQDLALGTAGDGFDPWVLPECFVTGASLGAPPDDFGPQGQDWGIPPLHPARLADDDFAYWRALLRAAFRHTGMLRIDHVLGCLRQWWIPRGRPAREGAYLRFPAADLLRVLAEESRRAGAVVVGEDLGTVPPGIPPLLARFGVLSSRVLLFERERDGRFKPARRYSARALATVNTHDLPPLAGWWTGRDIALRAELGLLEGAGDAARAGRERARDRDRLLDRLRREGCLPGAGEPEIPELVAGVHRFLSRTPAPLIGLSLDDLAGETEPVNLPGVSPSHFASWRRRMTRPLDELLAAEDVERALAGAATRALGS